jgi:hypothetical protein
MRCLAVLSLCLCLPACTSGAKKGDGGAPAPSASAPVSDGGAEDAGVGESRAELLAIFFEAARTNLERPYPIEAPSSLKRYAEAAAPLLDKQPHVLVAWGSAAAIVAEVLTRSEDERAPRALMDWAAQPAARRYLPDILGTMHARPREEYLATCRAILADETFAGEIVGHLHVDGGLLREALDMGVMASLQVMALELCAALPGTAGKALVRSIAMDRAASAPNPRTLAALECGEGEKRVEAEAQALASLRIMALSALRDRALLAQVAADPTEPALVRQWVKRMLQGGPDRSKPGWEKRLDPRQKQAYEQSMMEFVPFALAPCFTAHPRPILPSEGAPPGPGR